MIKEGTIKEFGTWKGNIYMTNKLVQYLGK